jgi:aconitate hydratase
MPNHQAEYLQSGGSSHVVQSRAGELEVGGATFRYFPLRKAGPDLSRLPVSLKILAENVLRNSPDDLLAFRSWLDGRGSTYDVIAYFPERVLMHDTTCVPALTDFAALRDAMADLGGDPAVVNPLIPVDLVVDHSVMVDYYGRNDAVPLNLERDFERNGERYAFIRWAQKSLSNFRVVPPGTGILHQINLEHLSTVVSVKRKPGAIPLLVPDTLVGTDSHTPMINALGIVAWGVGGIEGQAVALGESLLLRVPDVIGVRVTGQLRAGVTATDLALTVTEMMRRRGVVEKIVEFWGPGLESLSVADRGTIANMAPEYGATCSFFPIDRQTLDYLRLVGHTPEHVAIVEAYAHAQGLWHDPNQMPVFTDLLELDLGTVETSLAGPKRPQDRVNLNQVRESFLKLLPDMAEGNVPAPRRKAVPGRDFELEDGAVLIAAITSCTNTSNPALMVGAGLLARNARHAGLQVPPWVKTSLSPGSQAVTDYLVQSGLQDDLDALGFNLTGYGCMTCIGNSGGLDEAIAGLTDSREIVGAAVLSGNRNFEGRINPHIKAAYLASPALVVAYALAGSVLTDLRTEPVAFTPSGDPVRLDQIWPSDEEIQSVVNRFVKPDIFAKRFGDVFTGPDLWQNIGGTDGIRFSWSPESTYIRRPPYFEGLEVTPPGLSDVFDARALVVVGDSITTDHISPAGAIPLDSLAGQYLKERNVPLRLFNQYASRRGNFEVMMRGVFSNPRVQNELLQKEGIRGGMTRLQPSGEILPVYEAALRYKSEGVPLIIFAGKEYGTGSSRDWGAKGPVLLGVRAVIAESYERIHRSNLVGMGIYPLQFKEGMSRRDLSLDGTEQFDLIGLGDNMGLRPTIALRIRHPERAIREVKLLLRVETDTELEQLQHGGLLKYVLRDLFGRSCRPEGEGRPLAEEGHAGNGGGKNFAAELSEGASKNATFEAADEKVEEADEESFPASDSPAGTGVLGVGKRKRAEDVG